MQLIHSSYVPLLSHLQISIFLRNMGTKCIDLFLFCLFTRYFGLMLTQSNPSFAIFSLILKIYLANVARHIFSKKKKCIKFLNMFQTFTTSSRHIFSLILKIYLANVARHIF